MGETVLTLQEMKKMKIIRSFQNESLFKEDAENAYFYTTRTKEQRKVPMRI